MQKLRKNFLKKLKKKLAQKQGLRMVLFTSKNMEPFSLVSLLQEIIKREIEKVQG